MAPETPFFGGVAVLRGPLFVNTCGNAIGSCAPDFALIRKNWPRLPTTVRCCRRFTHRENLSVALADPVVA